MQNSADDIEAAIMVAIMKGLIPGGGPRDWTRPNPDRVADAAAGQRALKKKSLEPREPPRLTPPQYRRILRAAE